MVMRSLLYSTLLYLLWSRVEVHSQTEYPYVSFMGETLPNHAYVDLSLVGEDDSSSVQCHTDLSTCCTTVQGRHRGQWIAPRGEEGLPLANGYPIYQVQDDRRVDIHRRRGSRVDMSSGIYRCNIATIAVHGDDDISVRESVYVGMYGTGGIYLCTC